MTAILRLGCQRQDAVVVEDGHRLLRHLARERDRFGSLQRQLAVVGIGLLEQAHAEFLAQAPAHRRVDGFDVDQPAVERLRQVGRAIVAGQFDVEPGIEGERRGLGPVGGDAVVGVQQGDADVVGHDDAVEAPFVAQHLGQQVARGVQRLVVDVVVGRHDRAGIGELYRHLERQQEVVVQLAPAEMDRGVIAPAFGEGMAGVMLERGQHVAVFPLQAADIGRGHLAHEIGVFAEGLFGAAPAGVAGDVEHRGKALAAADGAQLGADGGADLLDQRRVPGGADRRARRGTSCRPVPSCPTGILRATTPECRAGFPRRGISAGG